MAHTSQYCRVLMPYGWIRYDDHYAHNIYIYIISYGEQKTIVLKINILLTLRRYNHREKTVNNSRLTIRAAVATRPVKYVLRFFRRFAQCSPRLPSSFATVFVPLVLHAHTVSWLEDLCRVYVHGLPYLLYIRSMRSIYIHICDAKLKRLKAHSPSSTVTDTEGFSLHLCLSVLFCFAELSDFRWLICLLSPQFLIYNMYMIIINKNQLLYIYVYYNVLFFLSANTFLYSDDFNMHCVPVPNCI